LIGVVQYVDADLKSQSVVVSVDSVKSRVDHAAFIVKSVYRSARSYFFHAHTWAYGWNF